MTAGSRPVVLPITSRGLEVTDRLCWGLLGVAMLGAAGLILYLNRATIFYLDELVWVYLSPGFDATYAIEPQNGHLVITAKLIYKAVLETLGTDYVAFRILHVLAALLAAGAFYTLVKRRIGALAALAPTVVLLFFGSDDHVLIPLGFSIILSIAAGLGALLALERGDRRGDVAACALLAFSIATFTLGLAFLVGVAISVLVRGDRARRAWIFLVPLALYVVWWAWSLSVPSSSADETRVSNVLLIPSWIVDSLAAVLTSLLAFDGFGGEAALGGLGWGGVLAAAAAIALALRLRRGGVPASLWAALGILLTYWCLGALAAGDDLRRPDATRYMYPGAVMVLLVAAEAARGYFGHPTEAAERRTGSVPGNRSVQGIPIRIAALFAVAAVCVAGNVAELRDTGRGFRAYSDATRAQFTALDLARGHVEPGFNPREAVPEVSQVGALAGVYHRVADLYGSLGYPVASLETQTAGARGVVDRILASALMLRLEPAAGRGAPVCETFTRTAAGGPVRFELPRGGAVLRTGSPEPPTIALGRFGDAAPVELGELDPRERASLAIPADGSPRPWYATVSGVRSVQVCGR